MPTNDLHMMYICLTHIIWSYFLPIELRTLWPLSGVFYSKTIQYHSLAPASYPQLLLCLFKQNNHQLSYFIFEVKSWLIQFWSINKRPSASCSLISWVCVEWLVKLSRLYLWWLTVYCLLLKFLIYWNYSLTLLSFIVCNDFLPPSLISTPQVGVPTPTFFKLLPPMQISVPGYA